MRAGLRTNRLQTFLLGTLSGAVLAFAVAVAAKHAEAPTPDAQACAPAGSTAPAVAAPPSSPSATSVAEAPKAVESAAPGRVAATMPLEVIDPARVDPQEIIGRVKGLALGVEKHAKLVHIVTSDLGQDGSIDLTSGGSIEYDFDFRYSDLGQNIIAGRVAVTVKQGGVTAALGPAQSDGPPEPLADPVCPLRSAWRQATKAGPPGGAAHAEYIRHPRTKGSVWTITAPGTPTYERSIDGLNCALLDGAPHRKKIEDPY